MDGRERLRRYLEQRRELGERELVLDGMTVDEVMRVVGARGQSATGPSGAPQAATRRGDDPAADAAPPSASDWRAALRAAGGEPATRTPRERSASPPPGDEVPAGLTVGSAGTDLFGGPFATLTSLPELAATVEKCTRCALYATATRGVPGEGNPNADLVCVGEAPGANEDATGRPFVGQAGQLLTKILGAINLRREDVFICNVLKHRPPGNRNPLPEEVVACGPYLVRQLELIRPKVIVAFGTFAAQTLLDTKLAIGKLRGSVHRYYGVPLVVTYHPAALLRNPAWKRPTWDDVQLARRILDSVAGA